MTCRTENDIIYIYQFHPKADQAGFQQSILNICRKMSGTKVAENWSRALSKYRHTSGKVREIYEISETQLLLVATDRISAYDWILPSLIPDKGRVLTSLSDFWFDRLGVQHHRLTSDISEIAASVPELAADPAACEALAGRAMLVKRLQIVPFECVVRGYLSGSGWREYRRDKTVCGIRLPDGLLESSRLPEPIFTPATKATSGHDENVSFDRMLADLGGDLAERLKHASIGVYTKAADWAAGQGLILADTKFEWGLDPATGDIVLADEVLTPDSSRYWDAALYAPGGAQPSFDKQFVRDWLDASGWDHASPPPVLPAEIVAKTRAKYVEAYTRVTRQAFPWAG